MLWEACWPHCLAVREACWKHCDGVRGMLWCERGANDVGVWEHAAEPFTARRGSWLEPSLRGSWLAGGLAGCGDANQILLSWNAFSALWICAAGGWLLVCRVWQMAQICTSWNGFSTWWI